MSSRRLLRTTLISYCLGLQQNFFHLDIVDGNMKAIMRLILALAAHFKPSSVRTPEPARVGRRLRRSESSLSAVAAEAAATLHDVSRAAASAGTPYQGSMFRYTKIIVLEPEVFAKMYP